MATTTLTPLAKLPSTSTFSFTAPFPPPSEPSPSSSVSLHKQQRRVSLALPSSPRQFPAWNFRDDTSVGVSAVSSSSLVPEKKGKIRRIASDEDDSESAMVGSSTLPQGQVSGSSSSVSAETKKQRRKWTDEETKMLVEGCQKWGVGNWKAILNDPELKFDNRSPVDLKDRFRTHFPDAYKHHYPNAKTHLSSKTRSTNTDGSQLFCATRSKKRRPFTAEEDAALKAGYDKHGTVWAAIVKDPIFQEQHRRSTDLRDRFRNAWPELYAKAGYKPRAAASKKKADVDTAIAGAGTNTAADHETGSQERPRALPIRAATDDQIPASSTMGGPVRRKRRHTTHGFGLFRGGTKSVPESMANSEDEDSCSEDEAPAACPSYSSAMAPSQPASETVEMEMDVSVPELLSSSTLSASDITDSSHSQTWLDTPLHSWSSSAAQTNANATPNPPFSESLAASPTPSTDYLLPHSPHGSTGMIGKSAWGPQDWLSPNPRLDTSGSSASSYGAVFSPSPVASPSSFSSHSQPLSLSHLSLNHLALQHSQGHGASGYSYSHGVVDRYDLLPLSHDLDLDLDFVSEGFGGTGDTHSAFSDPSAWAGAPGMRGGGFTHHSSYAGDLIFGARTHQPVGHSHMDYGPGFGFGLGLEGVSSQSVLHTPALPGIDEIELTNITLEDPREPEGDMVLQGPIKARSIAAEDANTSSVPVVNEGIAETFTPLALEEIVGIPPDEAAHEAPSEDGLQHTEDMSNHPTPPATPAPTFRGTARTQTFSGIHNRSISVPPSEHRVSLPPRPGQSQMVSPKAKHRSLMMPPTLPQSQSRMQTALPFVSQLSQEASQTTVAPPVHPTSYALPLPHADGANYKLPFLDLHYFTGHDSVNNILPHGHRPLGAQALDLAQTIAQSYASSSSTKQLCISPSLTELSGGAHGSDVNRSRLNSELEHGITSVSPQDILLRRGNENKRKRSSWDGGPR